MALVFLGCLAFPNTLMAEVSEPKTPAPSWALAPLVRPALPPGDHPIDAFIRAKLSEQQLRPSPEADRRTLLRRLSYGLTGLPPSPEDVQAFIASDQESSYVAWVDRLLASPHHGEHWARHWLDTVHFADTHGNDHDYARTNAWPYRDYVIQSFNQDKPYRRFVQEQIAGDALFPNDPPATVALGFLAAGPWDDTLMVGVREDTVDHRFSQVLDRDDIVTTVMSTFQSLTVHCARCHDHKFDPVSQKEYYQLQAVFAGVDRADRTFDPDPATHQRRQALVERQAAIRRRDPALAATLETPRVTAILAAWEHQRPSLPPALTNLLLRPAKLRSAAERHELAWHVLATEVERELSALPAPQKVYAVTRDFPANGSFKPALAPRPIHVLVRGDLNKPGEQVGPGALGCLPELDRALAVGNSPDEAARRAAFARWLTDDRNVLAWRSIVNRVWHYHFGRGLCDTPNDFGRMGGDVVHRALLDWLALWFRDEAQGSLKALHRLIVTSATYRQSAQHQPSAAERDPENRYLWRMNRLRLTAEQFRDSLLHLSGQLDPAMGGPSVVQFRHKGKATFMPDGGAPPFLDYEGMPPAAPENRRRAIYRFVFRTVPDPLMDALDAPDGGVLAPVRGESTTALQALVLLNHPWIIHQCEMLARSLAPLGEPRAQLVHAFQQLLQRQPSEAELASWRAYADRHGWANTLQLLVNGNEFLYLD